MVPSIFDHESFNKVMEEIEANKRRNRLQATCLVLVVALVCFIVVAVVVAAVFAVPIACLLYMLKGIKWLLMV